MAHSKRMSASGVPLPRGWQLILLQWAPRGSSVDMQSLGGRGQGGLSRLAQLSVNMSVLMGRRSSLYTSLDLDGSGHGRCRLVRRVDR